MRVVDLLDVRRFCCGRQLNGCRDGFLWRYCLGLAIVAWVVGIKGVLLPVVGCKLFCFCWSWFYLVFTFGMAGGGFVGSLGFVRCRKCGDYVWKLGGGHRDGRRYVCGKDGYIGCPYCACRCDTGETLNGHIFFFHSDGYGRWYRIFGGGLSWLSSCGAVVIG